MAVRRGAASIEPMLLERCSDLRDGSKCTRPADVDFGMVDALNGFSKLLSDEGHNSFQFEGRIRAAEGTCTDGTN
jgi:hypothetical protein